LFSSANPVFKKYLEAKFSSVIKPSSVFNNLLADIFNSALLA